MPRPMWLPALALFLAAASCSPPSSAPAGAGTAPPPATFSPAATAPPADPYTTTRLEMVEETIVARGVSDPDVLRAMRTVPRHRFVPAQYEDAAYSDGPLPIGYGQTISQPYVVAWMTELLALKPGEKVLEIGTGSGFQAAVLAELGYVDVYTIEIIPQLAQQAAARLQELGYGSVHLKEGDGYYGWEEYAPFDAIVVTAAPDHVPAPLVDQLKEGGRLVIPIGPRGGFQVLWRFVKEGGEVKAEELGWVGFVPMTGAAQENYIPGRRP